MNEKRRVLFLCTHNAARSQMAEALLRYHAGDRFEACSAGLDPTAVHPLTRQVLAEVGIESSTLQAKGLNEFLGKARVQYAIVVCGSAEIECPRVYPFAVHTLQWPFEDPAVVTGTAEDQLAAFRRVRDAIDTRVRDWVQKQLRPSREGQ